MKRKIKREIIKKIKRKLKGFSTMDLLVYFAVLGILLLVAIPNIRTVRDIANEFACKSELTAIKTTLELWHTKYREYPENLGKLVQENFLSTKGLTDPWGNEYSYRIEVRNNKNVSFTLSSAGKDGILGNEDDIASEE